MRRGLAVLFVLSTFATAEAQGCGFVLWASRPSGYNAIATFETFKECQEEALRYDAYAKGKGMDAIGQCFPGGIDPRPRR
jgi:hypothetical protein